MLRKNASMLGIIMACMLAFPAVTVNAVTKKQSNTNTTTKSTTIKQFTATSTSSQAVKVTDFGAHSITEAGYETFDSSQAITKAIQYAKQTGATSVDFGSGKYYAKDIYLESNIIYFSTQGAELIASPNTQLWHSLLTVNKKTNVTIRGLTINGNWDVVPGDMYKGSNLIRLSGSNNVLVENCYLYHNQSLGITIESYCNYITIRNNKIVDTDAGILSGGDPNNYITIDSNVIYGEKIKRSEPISIFSSTGKALSHDINITNNIVHDKSDASGIYVNATKVLIKGNSVYNCCAGINIANDNVPSNNTTVPNNDITITENNIHDCPIGILAVLSNSLISKNTINNINTGIWLMTKNATTPITNNSVTDNTITNASSKASYQAAIALQDTSNCLVRKNVILDTRSTVIHCFTVEIMGQKSSNNTIANNTSPKPNVQDNYQIYIQASVSNTILKNNKAPILDKGDNTKLIN